MVRNVLKCLDHETLGSVVFPNWFDEFSRSTEWYLYADSDGICFALLANVICIFFI